MASYLRICHNVWFLRGLPLVVFQRRMCSLHLQSWEPIIKCSAYEAGIYFKLLCQYFCLKAGLIPCVDFVEGFYHCFFIWVWFSFFPPWFCVLRNGFHESLLIGGGGGGKVALWISKPRKCKNKQTLAEGIREVTAIKQCVGFVTLKLLRIAAAFGIMEALDSNASGWPHHEQPPSSSWHVSRLYANV